MNTPTTTQPEDRYHYHVIRRAIEHIDAADVPLSLAALADELGMSAHHFQKTFSKWAGVSPKKFQQYLALDLAKSLLRSNHTTLDVATTAGLSSGGRLHDLFVTWEAMTPGEFARAGSDLEIAYGWVATPYGEALAMATARGICGMAFTSEIGRDAALEDMCKRWPKARYREDHARIAALVEGVLQGANARVHVMGGPFQIKVWEALLTIPSGRVTTYGDIAQAIGNPKAVRAVGTAVGQNPISWLIPCHRVLRKSGALGGYHWGTSVKRSLLAHEAVRADTVA